MGLVRRSNMKVKIGKLEFECTAEEFNKLDLSKTVHTIDSQFKSLEEIPKFCDHGIIFNSRE